MGTQLFEIMFKVHPTKNHPQADKFKFGVLYIWLYSTDAKSAAKFARRFLSALPYQESGYKSFAVDEQDPAIFSMIEIDCAVKAAQTGFNIDLRMYPLNANESEALKNWPSILPMLPPRCS